MQIITPYDLKPGDHFKFVSWIGGEFVFTKISHGNIYCTQIKPIKALCFFSIDVEPEFSRIEKIE
jgi:hypothetical protein